MGVPTLTPDERSIIARRLRDETKRPKTFPNPLQYVVALGLTPLEIRVPGFACEVTDRRLIGYPPCEPRKQGLYVYHALAHYLCGKTHSEADAWLLTGELVFPAYLARLTTNIREAEHLQQHAPGWFILCQCAYVQTITAQLVVT